MTALQSSYGSNRYGGLGEEDFYHCWSVPSTSPKPIIVLAHGHDGSARGLHAAVDSAGSRFYLAVCARLAEDYVVGVADLGGPSAWANGSARSAMSQYVSYLRGVSGWTGKVGLIGVSMGGGLCLNWAKANPGSAAWLAGVEPMINLNDLRSYQSSGSNDGVTAGVYSKEIDASYPPAYSDSRYGSFSNPYYYRGSYPSSSVRTAIWTTPDDPVVRNQFADAFVSANPTVERYQIIGPSGGEGHSLDAVSSAFQGARGLSVYEWARRRLSDSY